MWTIAIFALFNVAMPNLIDISSDAPTIQMRYIIWAHILEDVAFLIALILIVIAGVRFNRKFSQ